MPAVLFTVTLTSTHAAPLTKESIEEAGSSLMVAGWNTVHSFMRLVQFKKLNYVVEMVPYSHQLDYIAVIFRLSLLVIFQQETLSTWDYIHLMKVD